MNLLALLTCTSVQAHGFLKPSGSLSHQKKNQVLKIFSAIIRLFFFFFLVVMNVNDEILICLYVLKEAHEVQHLLPFE